MVMAASDCFNQLFFGGALMHAVIGIDVSKATSQVAVAVDGKVVQNFNEIISIFFFANSSTFRINIYIFSRLHFYRRHLVRHDDVNNGVLDLLIFQLVDAK